MSEPDENTPLFKSRTNSLASSADFDDDFDDEELKRLPSQTARKEAMAAERLSIRLLAVEDGDEAAHERILLQSLRLESTPRIESMTSSSTSDSKLKDEQYLRKKRRFRRRLGLLLSFATVVLVVGGIGIAISSRWVHVGGPVAQPVGPYRLLERQEGFGLLDYYTFYEGKDSQGSNGYITYVNRDKAIDVGILNVTTEHNTADLYDRRRLQSEEETNEASDEINGVQDVSSYKPEEEFLFMGTSATEEGPRDSIRLEGKRRFDRGLFIIDVRHMPAGCGVWPAFWLTDEANWPVNGEIDIVEGVNYQTTAKTALHSTKGCSMTDIPLGTMTGGWDTATGIPDKKTGIPDTTFRYAQDCFVYNPKQWLNQGCVAVDLQDGTIGAPLNDNGGGVYALEWDPINRHIRSWIFSPHGTVPDNLALAIETAKNPTKTRVLPNPEEWPLPYGYFSIGEGTDCPVNKFKRMRLVFNTAFCGSVAGNRFQMDCPVQAKQFSTCNEWVASNPEEMDEAYWKVRGVYVYEREWEKAWVS